tara:strand:- start:1463 stop:2176 length:714 start_codon:yes stop_codon:yes gene_type:complete
MKIQQKIFKPFGSEVTLIIKRTLKLKSISIKIDKNNIKIIAPFFLSNKKVDEFIKKKNNWIKKQILIQSNIQPLIKKEYRSGEKFEYLGQSYALKVIKGINYSVKIENDLLITIVKDIENTIKIKRLIKKWFHEQSNYYFKEKTIFYAKMNNLNVKSIKVREYKSRWGSCSIEGNITFNWKLIMAPPKIIEYVIIHELIHLKEHNHSPKYWTYVKALYPNIDEAKKWLTYNGESLNI